jgi:hypothetical protein
MSCDTLRKLLSEGLPLTAAAEEHLRSCPGCTAMLEALAAPSELPDPQLLARIEQSIDESLRPVRPLPSDRTMIALATGLLVAFAGVIIPHGFKALHVLTATQKLLYYAVIAVSAVLVAAATVHEMIPGSRMRIRPTVAVAAALFSISAIVTLLFQDFRLTEFVKLGLPCLEVGTACAFVAALLASFLLRKGFPSSPVRLFVTAGSLSGLAGVAALALHCPIENSAHVIVWHLGVIVIGAAAGAAVGISREYLSKNNISASAKMP